MPHLFSEFRANISVYVSTFWIALWGACFAFTSPVSATNYPDFETRTVNDFAGLLSDIATQDIAKTLEQLRVDMGIEMTVVTLSRKSFFDPDISLENFATGLFNHWGIGDKNRNDGILFLVLHADREVRIELGQGFGRDWDRAAAKAIDRAILPAFRDDKYEVGILNGVDEIIATIAAPYLNGDAAPKASKGIFWPIAAAVTIGLLIMKNWVMDRVRAWRPCPNCGKRALSVHRTIKTDATTEHSGGGIRTVQCANCNHRDLQHYSIARRRSSSKSFGGGRSGGGGASGRW